METSRPGSPGQSPGQEDFEGHKEHSTRNTKGALVCKKILHQFIEIN